MDWFFQGSDSRALSYDDHLADAYIVRSEYYRREGRYMQAIQDNEKAIEINPNDWWAYSNMGYLYAHPLFEFELAFEYFQKSLELSGDTLAYIGHLAINESFIGNYPERLRLEEQLFKRDISAVEHFFMGEAYRENKRYDKSLYHYEVYLHIEAS
jgi:tetratricopeptide (TPR) repeat protein